MTTILSLLSRPEFGFLDLLFPWIAAIGLAGFLVGWLIVAIMERTGVTRYVWHLPLFFVGLVILFTSLIGMVVFP
jgi:hypothetical protein